MTTVAVVGGGFAGMLAATAMARFADVMIIDNDTFPADPGPRRGLPQGRQNHMLMAGGAEALDQLLPGTTSELFAAGAHKLSLGNDLLTLAAGSWLRRFEDESYVITCRRQLLDHVVRGQALQDPAITVLQGAKAVGLAGTTDRVTGVLVEQGGRELTLDADFVVDTTGSRTKSPQWLAELGLPPVLEEYVDARLVYASRLYEAPVAAPADFPGVLIQPQSQDGGPGQGAAFMPQEDGKWIVSLIGTGSGHPPTDEEGFLAFARRLPVPVISDLIGLAQPLSPIRGAHGLANRRRRFDRMPLPQGFLVLGDAAMVISPNYATGMSIAALSALRLRTELKMSGLNPDLGRQLQPQIAKTGLGPWKNATALDSRFPGATTNIRVRGARMQQRMTARYSRIAAENPKVMQAIYRVASLRATQNTLTAFSIIRPVLLGPRKPTLSVSEAISQFPEITSLLAKLRPGQATAPQATVPQATVIESATVPAEAPPAEAAPTGTPQAESVQA